MGRSSCQLQQQLLVGVFEHHRQVQQQQLQQATAADDHEQQPLQLSWSLQQLLESSTGCSNEYKPLWQKVD